VNVDSAKYVPVGHDVLARHHLDPARCDERLVEPPELITQGPGPPSTVRGRRPYRVFDDGIVRIEREPPFFVVLSGNLRGCLGGSKKGVPVG